ncbi:MAG TPA: 50S ribosomal protein L25 [Polyangiales bacterium]|nr:50S ribosomal protein L25 [Polyangiales bacterium]
MEKQTLSAEVRTLRGKGPARQLRFQGKIPAVLYGPGGETEAITLDPLALTKALTGPFAKNQLLEIEIGGKKQFATIKDLDVHPVSRLIRHADFYRVSLETPATYEVPLKTTGRAKGVVKGGELRQLFRTLPVRVTPDKVPAEIVLNVENLDMLESIRAKDVVLEHGEIVLPEDRAVVSVTTERKIIAEEEGTPGAPGTGNTTPPPAAKAAAKPAGKK